MAFGASVKAETHSGLKEGLLRLSPIGKVCTGIDPKQKNPDAWASGLGQARIANDVTRLLLVLERNADGGVAYTYLT